MFNIEKLKESSKIECKIKKSFPTENKPNKNTTVRPMFLWQNKSK